MSYPPRFAKVNDYPGVARRIAPGSTPRSRSSPIPMPTSPGISICDVRCARCRSEDEATALLAAPPKARLLIRAEDWQRLKPQADAAWQVLDEGQVGRRRFVLLGG